MVQFWWRRASPAVLIISDNPAEPLFESPFLSQSNLRLTHAPADPSCLRTARRMRPRLIIGEVGGDEHVELCRRLRADPQTRSIPLILITSEHSPQQLSGARPDELLSRPLSRGKFFDAVRRFVPLPHRRTERVAVNLRFTYDLGDRVHQAFSRDLSCRGAFLKADCLPPLGSRLGVSFSLPGSWEELRCDAVVRSHAAEVGAGKCRGFGIEFEGLAEDAVDRLEAFIERNRTPGLLSL